MEPATLILFLIAGAAAGIISGLMGVGGGIVMTPVLHYVVGLDWKTSVALSLFAIMIQAPVGIQRHHRKGAVDSKVAMPLVMGGVVGVLLGVILLDHVPVAVLRTLFALLMLFAAWRLGKEVEVREGHPGTGTMTAVGIAAGTVSRLLGVGGGIITVPVATLMGVPVHTAVGSSLVPVFTNALVATVLNLYFGLEWLIAVPLAIGALVGTFGGSHLAHRLPPVGLRRVVAIGLVVTAAYILVRNFI